MKIEFCPLCGWGPFKNTYESAQELRGSYDICECCGCEYGHDDDEDYYKEWVSKGCEWFEPELKPNDWSLENQKKHQVRPWPPTIT